MSGEMRRRTPTTEEQRELNHDVRALAWGWARRLADLGPDDAPASVWDDGLTDDQIGAARLAELAVLKLLGQEIDQRINENVLNATQAGVDLPEIADVMGVTRQNAEHRWGHLGREGKQVAVVISRRNRVRENLDGVYGEVGGRGQYDSDRRAWPIGRRVRTEARYAIIAVDGTVRRIYALDPDGWRETSPNKWEFTAAGERELTKDEIDAAYTAGQLPLRHGDDCPTRVGGAYRPHWF